MPDVNYTGVNFEDKPSTNTPINAANLNKLNKGIKDCAESINISNQVVSGLKSNLKANNKDFKFDYNDGEYGYRVDNTFHPFKHPTGTKSITANGVFDVTDYASVNVNVSTINPSNAKVVKQEQAGTATFTGCVVGKTYAITRFWYGGPQSTTSTISGASVLYSQLFRSFAETNIYYINAMVWVVKATSSTISANRVETADYYDDNGRNPSYTSIVQLD